MAKCGRARHRTSSRRIRPSPYLLLSSHQGGLKNLFAEKCPKKLNKQEWEDVICSVCMECPHNAVLLLCSSHEKGCRPYMCGTSFRYSNCLHQYKKASAKLILFDQDQPNHKSEISNLTCPLCRGQVKGWTVVEPAREYLNLKKRSCMQENCSFIGSYKNLRKHMRADHPFARPRKVDPALEGKWRRMEHEHARDDVISIIRSTMPGSMVYGDYVMEGNPYDDEVEEDHDDDDHHHHVDQQRNLGGFDSGFGSNLVNVFLLLHAFGTSGNRTRQPHGSQDHTSDENDLGTGHPMAGVALDSSDQEDVEGGAISLASRLRQQGRFLLGRSGRRRRHRVANRGHR